MIHPKHRPGFSLIELLTVIAIIAVLASLMLPVLGRARQTAAKMACANSVRHIALASLLASEDYDGRLPTDYEGSFLVGFHYQVLPYLQDSVGEESISTIFGCPAGRDTRQTPEWHQGMRYNYAVNQDLPGSQVSEITMPAQRVMWFDSPRTVDARASRSFWTAAAPYRHRGALNAVYLDGHTDDITLEEAKVEGRFRRNDIDTYGPPKRRAGIALTSSGAPARPTHRPQRWSANTTADTAPAADCVADRTARTQRDGG
jgi:prepilin-type N-terminal cleavage/methylation domain-containing protein/prepilin-type processing-associated H-X9-DG protein